MSTASSQRVSRTLVTLLFRVSISVHISLHFGDRVKIIDSIASSFQLWDPATRVEWLPKFRQNAAYEPRADVSLVNMPHLLDISYYDATARYFALDTSLTEFGRRF